MQNIQHIPARWHTVLATAVLAIVFLTACSSNGAGGDSDETLQYTERSLTTLITGPTTQFQDTFGDAVAITDEYLAAGLPSHDNGIFNSGAVYVFRRTGTDRWDAGTKLQASGTRSESELFGASVAIDDAYLVVGAPGRNSREGAVYVYRRTGFDTWDSGTQILAPVARRAASTSFGGSVGLSGDYAIVGALLGANASGAAYVFQRTGPNTWSDGIELAADDGMSSDFFGAAVAIDGAYAVVGAYGDDGSDNENQGAAYVFYRDGAGSWSQVAKLTAPNPGNRDRFGISVAIDGEFLVVGADDEGESTGWAYVFRRTGPTSWDSGTRIVGPDSAAGDRFGESVAIDGDYVLVGAPSHTIDSSPVAGAAYLFQRTPAAGSNAWAPLTKLTERESDRDNSSVGASVAIEGTQTVVGAPNAFGSTGRVWLYRR